MPEFQELSKSSDDRLILSRFYRGPYSSEFPDPDERESLENMEEYLRLKSQGWYGNNNYHIVVANGREGACAGSIGDFLAEPNAGVVEFLVVAKEQRGRGLGKRLLDHTERLLVQDAADRFDQPLGCIVAEMNDPFKIDATKDNLDPFLRAAIWHKWGYRRLDFPYVQPALSQNQRPVRHLMLIAKALRPQWQGQVPAPIVRSIVHEYIRWAMRIQEPRASADYRRMADFLNGVDSVALQPLGAYLGDDPSRPLTIRELPGAQDPDFSRAIAVYNAAFPEGPTSIDAEAFARALANCARFSALNRHYHFWAVRSAAPAAVEGLASFFTFPEAGFGGYVALDGRLRGSGRFPLLLARIERQMLRDEPRARGWYIECRPQLAALFRKQGFSAAAVNYRQPAIAPSAAVTVQQTPPLVLMYKHFGRSFDAPRVPKQDFLAAMTCIYETVYSTDPRTSALFADLRSQAEQWDSGWTPFTA